MKIHEFNLILTREPDEAEADAIAGVIDDASIATIAGVPQLWFHREAASLEAAIESAVRDVQKAGFEVAKAEVETEGILAAAIV